jgi:hypothetical protein
MHNLLNTLMAATIVACFALLFWMPVVGAVVPSTETLSPPLPKYQGIITLTIAILTEVR